MTEWMPHLNKWLWDEQRGLKQTKGVETYLSGIIQNGWNLAMKDRKRIIHAYEDSMKNIFEVSGIWPDALQFALASYAIQSIKSRPLQIINVMSGLGKTRMVHAAALYGIVEMQQKKIHIVLPNNHLVARESKQFESYWRMTGSVDKIAYHTTLDFPSEIGSVVLIDEVDYFLYNDPNRFYALTRDKVVIGFTATTGTHKLRTIEKQVLSDMQFVERSYWPKDVEKPVLPFLQEKVNANCFRGLNEWLRN